MTSQFTSTPLPMKRINPHWGREVFKDEAPSQTYRIRASIDGNRESGLVETFWWEFSVDHRETMVRESQWCSEKGRVVGGNFLEKI